MNFAGWVSVGDCKRGRMQSACWDPGCSEGGGGGGGRETGSGLGL